MGIDNRNNRRIVGLG